MPGERASRGAGVPERRRATCEGAPRRRCASARRAGGRGAGRAGGGSQADVPRDMSVDAGAPRPEARRSPCSTRGWGAPGERRRVGRKRRSGRPLGRRSFAHELPGPPSRHAALHGGRGGGRASEAAALRGDADANRVAAPPGRPVAAVRVPAVMSEATCEQASPGARCVTCLRVQVDARRAGDTPEGAVLPTRPRLHVHRYVWGRASRRRSARSARGRRAAASRRSRC